MGAIQGGSHVEAGLVSVEINGETVKLEGTLRFGVSACLRWISAAVAG